MNGDTETFTAGAGYPSSAETSMTAVDQTIILPANNNNNNTTINQTIYRSRADNPETTNLSSTMNGAISGNFTNDGGELYAENVDASGAFITAEGNTLPLDQLKQMLSTQLEYYFSR